MNIRSNINGRSADTIQAIVTGILQACEDNVNASGLTAELAVLSSAHDALTARRAHQLALQIQLGEATESMDAASHALCAAYEKLAARAEALPEMTPDIARRLGFEASQNV